MDILRSSDYSNTETYLKMLHPTAGEGDGGGGGVVKQYQKHASSKKNHRVQVWEMI